MAEVAPPPGAPRTNASIRTGPEFRFTREGRVFILATLGVGLGAVNTGNNLLYLVLGLMLGLVLTSGVLSEIVLRGVRVTRLASPRLFAAEPGLFELEVTNDKRWLASTSFEVGDIAQGDDGPVIGYVLKLEPRAVARVVVTRTPRTRGRLVCTHVRVRTRFPFGLLEKSRTVRAPTTCVVFPRIVPVELPAPNPRRLGFDESVRTGGSGTEIAGLRDHREGDALRDVHWRRSASLGRTVVRERTSEQEDQVELVLVTRIAGDDASRERFERDVSEAASRAIAAIGALRPVRIRSESGAVGHARGRGELDALLHVLALIEPTLEHRPPATRNVGAE